MDEDDALAELDEAIAVFEARGDHPGHRFHGNQYGGGGGGRDAAAILGTQKGDLVSVKGQMHAMRVQDRSGNVVTVKHPTGAHFSVHVNDITANHGGAESIKVR